VAGSAAAALGSERWAIVGVCCALAAAIWLVFGQTLQHGFVNYDDDAYVYNNPVVRRGLTRDGIVWAFTQTHAANWHPLTWLSHMLDSQLFGLEPAGHHLSSILLHLVAAVLLFLVLGQMTGALWRSAFVAMLFAIHPLRVESVAWVSERKDVLSGLCFMLTLGAYDRYVRRPGSRTRYLALVGMLSLGLMAKPMLVTVPVVLLLLDYWPLGRLRAMTTGTATSRAALVRRSILEKVPLVGMAVASGLVTIVAQRGALQPLEQISMPDRIGNALISYVAYLGDLVYPVGLVVFRPHDPPDPVAVALAFGLLACITIAAIRLRHDRPYVLVGWLWYVVMLVPVIGIVQVGSQARADRFTYLPQIGIVLALTWAAADAARAWRHGQAALMATAGSAIVVLVLCARAQTSYWRSSESLWTHALAHTSRNALAHGNLGAALMDSGRAEEAMPHLRAALALIPHYPEARANLGNALLAKGHVHEGMAHYRRALKVDPGHANAALGLANALARLGRGEDAIVRYRQAMASAPDNVIAHNNLGNALLGAGQADEALQQFRTALDIDPQFALAENTLASALLQAGALDEAVAHYRRALEIDPRYAEAHHNLGLALFRTGRGQEAMASYRTALTLRPDYPDAHNDLAVACMADGRMDEAIAHYRQALAGQPESVMTLTNLAHALAAGPDVLLRRPAEALELAERAAQLSRGRNAEVLRTLAIAYGEVGRIDDALRTGRDAIALARTDGQAALASQMEDEIERLRLSRGVRHSSSTADP